METLDGVDGVDVFVGVFFDIGVSSCLLVESPFPNGEKALLPDEKLGKLELEVLDMNGLLPPKPKPPLETNALVGEEKLGGLFSKGSFQPDEEDSLPHVLFDLLSK